MKWWDYWKDQPVRKPKPKGFIDPDLPFKRMQEAGYRWPVDIKQDESEMRTNQEKRL